MHEPYEVEKYRPVSRRRRLLLLALAVVTGLSLLGYMRGRKGDIESLGPVLPGDVAACKNGKAEGCVGGLVTVIVPPASTASAARP